MSRSFGRAIRGGFAVAVVFAAVWLSAGCGSSAAPPASQPVGTASPTVAVSTPAQPSPSAPPSVVTEAAVQAVVQAFFPPGPNDVSAGCDSGPCPITARLKTEIARLKAQTPAPAHTGDLCNFDLLTGNQDGMATPVHAVVETPGDRAQAAVEMNGQTSPIVTLVVIDSGGTPLVDDILYDIQRDRSIYSLNCTNSFGG